MTLNGLIITDARHLCGRPKIGLGHET